MGKIRPEQLRLYAVTEKSHLRGKSLLQAVEEAICGGATMVQLRDKTPDRAAFLTEAAAIRDLCRQHAVPFILNDDPYLAIELEADGVHLGQDDMGATQARSLLGPDRIIGVSAHNPEEARLAEEQGADYLGCGAVFGSTTKTNIRPINPAILRQVTAAVSIPVVAIGGINCSNLPQLYGCGLAGVAVVSALFSAGNIREAAAAFLPLLEYL